MLPLPPVVEVTGPGYVTIRAKSRGESHITTPPPLRSGRIDNLIRISIYPYIMPKVKLTISIGEEIAKDLRARSIDKYGNSRSLSQLIEDLATGSAEPAPPVCQIGLMSKWGISRQEEFNKAVEAVSQQLKALDMPLIQYPAGPNRLNAPEVYFILKEVMEQRLNRIADDVSGCPSCHGLDEPLPTYPDAGHNFEKLYLVSNRHR